MDRGARCGGDPGTRLRPADKSPLNRAVVQPCERRRGIVITKYPVALIESSKATRFGPHWPGKRCLAQTGKGTPCQNPAIRGRTRCKLHGGRSTGPRTPEGKARSIAAHWRHGRRSKAHVEKVKAINAELRRVINEMRQEGLIP